LEDLKTWLSNNPTKNSICLHKKSAMLTKQKALKS